MWTLVAQWCNLSERDASVWMDMKYWNRPGLHKNNHKVPLHPSYDSATLPESWTAGKTKPEEAIIAAKCGGLGHKFNSQKGSLLFMSSILP